MNRIKIKVIMYILKLFNKSTVLKIMLNQRESEAINYINYGFLAEKGFWKSWESNESIDDKGAPLPWLTYSFLDFIKDRLQKEMILFEFGSGNSTLFYSKFVNEVHTVEHDLKWYNKLKQNLPDNVYLNHITLKAAGDYSRAVYTSENRYDVILVDGRDRTNSLINSIKGVKENGVIILDDSEREEYYVGVSELKKSGYKRLDFWGISPGFMAYNKCTSIFYKDNNVLGI